MGAQNQANNPETIVAFLGTISDAGDYPVAHIGKRFIVKKVVLLDQAGIAASDTNYVTLTLKNGSTSLASYDSRAANEGAVTANTAAEFTIANSGTEIDLAKNSDLKLTYAEGGTGTLTLAQLVLYGHYL